MKDVPENIIQEQSRLNALDAMSNEEKIADLEEKLSWLQIEFDDLEDEKSELEDSNSDYYGTIVKILLLIKGHDSIIINKIKKIIKTKLGLEVNEMMEKYPPI